MSEDLNKKIKQITDMLGQENVPDNVKGLLSLLTNSNRSSEEPPQKAGQQEPAGEARNEKSELEENLKMMNTVKNVMDRLNSHTDPRINLLSALKPFMGSARQKKIGNCINVLRISSLARLIDENGNGIF